MWPPISLRSSGSKGCTATSVSKRFRPALSAHSGVREVEVDFASGQASVLFDRDSVSVKDLMDSINNAGYRATGFNVGQGQAGGQRAKRAKRGGLQREGHLNDKPR